MTQRLLVVLDNQGICPPALAHARELAKRLDAEVTLLMLVEMAFLDTPGLGFTRHALQQMEQEAGDVLTELTGEFIHEGISTTVAIRKGDPAEELCKFLAEHPPVQVLIWGGSEELPPGGRKGHWMTRVARNLECPLWTVGSRRPPSTSPPADGKSKNLTGTQGES